MVSARYLANALCKSWVGGGGKGGRGGGWVCDVIFNITEGD